MVSGVDPGLPPRPALSVVVVVPQRPLTHAAVQTSGIPYTVVTSVGVELPDSHQLAQQREVARLGMMLGHSHADKLKVGFLLAAVA